MTGKTRDVWGANQYEDTVKRNTKWMQDFVVAAVRALKRDGRPLGTEKVNKADRLARLLEAGPEFWDALQQNDPEAAAQMAADIIRARAEGRIPPQGPRVGDAAQIEEQQAEAAPTGTQRAAPIAPSIVRGAEASEQIA